MVDAILIPRREGPDGPIWDATDEMYITYREGERVLITTDQPQQQIWTQEAASAKYEAVGDWRVAPTQRLGLHPSNAAGRVRPGQGTDVTPDDDGRPPFLAYRDWDDTRIESHRGTRSHTPERGAGLASLNGHTRDRAEWGSLPVRSHRHCPGCAGHERVSGGFAIPVLRAILAWFIGWFGFWLAGISIDPFRYIIVTGCWILLVVLGRPLWREYVGHKDYQARGGRR